MFKVSKELMEESLEVFGESYNCPVYISIVNMSSFFSSRRNIHYGYAAITDSGCIIITEYSLFSEQARYTIPLDSIKSLKVKKVLFGLGHNIKLESMCEGKKLRLEISVSNKAPKKEFEEHKENAELFMKALSHCPVFKGKI